MPSRLSWTLRVAFGALLALAFPLTAQRDPVPGESFGEAIDVNVVNLDVFVTSKKGKPVEGLTAEDFEVFEDGKPVKITNFYAEKGGPAAAPEAAKPAAADRPVDQRLRLVIFVDDVNMEPAGRARILGSLEGFLRGELAPGDEVMLVRYNLKLDIRRSFTSDLGLVTSDVTELVKMSSDLRKYDESRNHAVEDIIDAIYAGDGWGPLAEGRINAFAEQESAVVKGALDALDSVVSWLSGVAGRKAILYVSDGLPLRPGDDLFAWAAARSGYRAGRRISAVGSLDLSKRFREVTSHASRNRITVYPIEGYGVRTVRGTAIQEVLVGSRQDGLRFLAQDTGGRVMLNAGDPVSALRLMGEDLSSYYSLGYQPDRPGDEMEHKIEVKVKARDAQVRHRQWYRDKPVGESVAERALAVMRFGPEDNPLGATLEIGEAEEQGGLVPVRIKLPVSKLYLEPKEGVRKGKLRLYVVASGEGTTTPVRQTRVVAVEIPEAEATAGTQREYIHDVGIPLRQGSWSVGVAVRDETAKTTSYLRKDFTVAAPGPAR